MPSHPSADQRTLSRPPLVTYGLIGVCTLVFLLSPASGPATRHGSALASSCAQALYFERWGVVPAELWHATVAVGALGLPPGCAAPSQLDKVPVVSVLTALFVHGSWLHLAGNMLFLYVFGVSVEQRMGAVRFAAFYLAAGYLATYGYGLANATSAQTVVGASGAIAGVLGGSLYLYPKARVTSLFPFLFFLPLRFPAWLVLGFWFALQWLSARTDQVGPGVAYLAHVVGFSFGFLCAAACYRVRSRTGGGRGGGTPRLGARVPSRGEGQP